MNKTFYETLIKEARGKTIYRYVVGAVIERDHSILLLERPKDDFMGGIYELPGGKVEDGESLDLALFREVKEETGLNIGKIEKYLGYFDYESRSGKKTRQFNFAVTIEGPLEVRLQEHKNYVWTKRDGISKYPVTDNVKRMLDSFFETV